MGLLKAARGAVIDDLAIEWTPEFKETGPFDDDFEVIDTPEPKEDVAPEPQAPLSLFDEMDVDTPVEVGAQKAIGHLAPPPRIQQAPKSGKLPIPLYPGFRCSIFAIVKQPPNAGSHSSEIKITGKVLGRDVAFSIPVAPVSVDHHVLEGIEGGKLLHTLAAKQLIQTFEEFSKTPENKAEIERLGKRYSLASSVTSFVAIDGENGVEVEGHNTQVELVAHDKESKMNNVPRDNMRYTDTRALDNIRYTDTRVLRASASPSAPIPGFIRPAAPLTPLFGGPSPSSSSSYATPSALPPPPALVDVGASGTTTGSQDIIASSKPDPHAAADGATPASPLPLACNLTGYARVSLGALGDDTEYMEDDDWWSSPNDDNDDSEGKEALESVSRNRLAAHLFGSLGGSTEKHATPLPPPPPAPVLALTVENLARAQDFDGSFPSTDHHMQFLFGTSSSSRIKAETLPASLGSLPCAQEVKKKVWSTILTLASLDKAFKGDKDSWEMLAEKAMDYILGVLEGDCGLSSDKAQVMVAELKINAASSL